MIEVNNGKFTREYVVKIVSGEISVNSEERDRAVLSLSLDNREAIQGIRQTVRKWQEENPLEVIPVSWRWPMVIFGFIWITWVTLHVVNVPVSLSEIIEFVQSLS